MRLPGIDIQLGKTYINTKTMNKIRVTQRVMERFMLGVTLRDKVQNEERRRTKVTDAIERITHLKKDLVYPRRKNVRQ